MGDGAKRVLAGMVGRRYFSDLSTDIDERPRYFSPLLPRHGVAEKGRDEGVRRGRDARFAHGRQTKRREATSARGNALVASISGRSVACAPRRRGSMRLVLYVESSKSDEMSSAGICEERPWRLVVAFTTASTGHQLSMVTSPVPARNKTMSDSLLGEKPKGSIN